METFWLNGRQFTNQQLPTKISTVSCTLSMLDEDICSDEPKWGQSVIAEAMETNPDLPATGCVSPSTMDQDKDGKSETNEEVKAEEENTR